MEARLCGLLLVMTAYALTAGTGMMALNDPCVLSCGPDWMSPAGNAVFMALDTTAAMFALTPCTMQHLAALCVLAGPCHILPLYIRSQRRHVGLGFIYSYMKDGDLPLAPNNLQMIARVRAGIVLWCRIIEAVFYSRMYAADVDAS